VSGATVAGYLSKGQGSTCRQEALAVYALNGSIYVGSVALAHAAIHGLWSVHIAPVMPRWKSVDIDDLRT
jgi:CMP-N-acetylneuraminic acid synthetase